MRKILIISAAFLALLLGVALIGPSFVNWNTYRGQVETLVKNASGRDITIAGDLAFRVLPSPRLSVEGVTLANPPGFESPYLVEADRLELGVALLPLISNRIEVKRLYLIGPKVHLEQLADGRNNWSFGGGDDEGGGRGEVGVNDLRIEGGMVSYRDAQSDRMERVENINLALSLPSLEGPFSIDGALAYDGHTIEMKGTTGRLNKSGAPISLRATLDGAYNAFIEGQIADSSADLSQLEITSADMTLRGDAQLRFGDITDVSLNLNEVDVKRLLGAPQNPVTGLSLRISQQNEGFRVDTAEAALLGGGALHLTGQVREGGVFDGRIELTPQSPRALVAALSPETMDSLGELALESLRINAALEATNEGVYLRGITGRLDDMDVAGDIVFLNRPRPYFSTDLRLGEVDLARLLPPAPEDAPLTFPDLTALKGVDGLLNMKIARLRQQGAPDAIGPITLSASLNQGELKLEQALLGSQGGDFWGVTGTVKDLGPTPRLDLSLNAKAATLGRLVSLTGTFPMGSAQDSGPISLSGTLAGTFADLGLDLSMRLASLDGRVRGHVQGLDTTSTRFDLTMDISHKSLASLLQEFGALQADSVAEGAPLKVNLRLRGGAQDIVAAGQLAAGDAGTISLTLDQKTTGGSADISLAMTAKAPKTIAFVQALGFPFNPARDAIGAMDISLMVTGKGSAFSLSKLSAAFGDIRFSGTGDINTAGAVPVANINLDADTLDFNAFLSEVETGAEAAAQSSALRWSEEPLDLSALGAVDGTLNVKAKTLLARAYRVDNAVLRISSKGPTLRVEDLSGQMFGGTARISGLLDGAAVPRFEVSMAMEGTSVEAAMLAATAAAPLTGTMGMTGSFSGQGQSQKAIVASLQGTAKLSAANGIIRRVDIPRINTQLGQLSTVNDFVRLTSAALSGGQTAYRSMNVDLVANKGILTTQNFATDIDGGADVGLDARVNLPEWTIDAKGSFRLRDHPDAPAVGMTMKGNLSTPEVLYQTKALQQYMGVRLGAAVLKGVVRGEGVGLGDLMKGSEQKAEDPNAAQQQSAEGETAPTPAPDPKKPEEEIRDILIDIFTKKKKEAPPN